MPIPGTENKERKITVEMLNQMEVKPPTIPSEAGYESSMVISMARGMLDTVRLVPVISKRDTRTCKQRIIIIIIVINVVVVVNIIVIFIMITCRERRLLSLKTPTEMRLSRRKMTVAMVRSPMTASFSLPLK